MTYIIENAFVLKGGVLKELSLLVENNKIALSQSSLDMYKHLRMNASDYIMTPTHVLLDFNLPFNQPFAGRKAYYLNKFIMKGCTTILTCALVRRERELTSQLKKIQSQMLDCPIDYVIGVRIPAKLVTASFLRRCKREKVPAIFVEISELSELEKIAWGWVKEAMFPYNSPLIPVFLSSEKRLPKIWGDIMKMHNIPCLMDELAENTPMNRKYTEKIGIYPKKSYLHHGGEVSYNFYLKDRETVKMIERELFTKHDSHLIMTIHKGKVIRAGGFLSYRPGDGEHVVINTPSFYLTPT